MQSADAIYVSYRFGLLIGWHARTYCSCCGSVVDMFGCWSGGRPVHAAAAVGVWLYVCIVVCVADQCIPRLLRECGCVYGLMVGWQTSAIRGCYGIVGCACAGFGGSLTLYSCLWHGSPLRW